MFRLTLTIKQGIPENVQENPPATRQAAPAGGANIPQATTQPAATGDDAEGDDAPVNLFEAAANIGRGGAAGRGGARATAAGSAGAGASLLQGLTAGQDVGNLGNLDFLRTNPQFQQLRQIVQTQPRMLEPILQQVGAGNPGLATLIGNNPDQFLSLLSEDGEEDGPMPPGSHTVSVTEEERDAIDRVSFMVFVKSML